MADEKEIFAPFAHKLLVAITSTLFGVISLAGVWLWNLGHMPGLFSLVFGSFAVFFSIRLRAVIRNPVIAVDGPIIRVLGWSGNFSEIDLRAAMDVAIGTGKIVVKQGRVGIGISEEAVGKEQFSELVDMFKLNQSEFQESH